MCIKLHVKKCIVAAIAFAMAGSAFGQRSSSLTAEQRRTTASLTISGTVSDEDFRIMRDEMVALTSVELRSAELAELPANAFSGMSRLSSVVLPSSLTAIGEGAFLMNTSLTGALMLPSSVTHIGRGAFFGASDIHYFLYDNVYHINAAGQCYIDPASTYGNNVNRTFVFYMQSPVYDHAAGSVVAIAGNGTIWKASDSGTNLATRSFTEAYP